MCWVIGFLLAKPGFMARSLAGCSARARMVAASALIAAVGCGGLQSERADPDERETSELAARDWHLRAVELHNDAMRALQHDGDCELACSATVRGCELRDDICDLAEHDSNDEGTQMLCEDSDAHCRQSEHEIASGCDCSTGARHSASAPEPRVSGDSASTRRERDVRQESADQRPSSVPPETAE